MKLRCNKANELKQQWNEGNYIPKSETQKVLKHNKWKIQKNSYVFLIFVYISEWSLDAIKPMNLNNNEMKEIIFQRWKHRKDRSMNKWKIKIKNPPIEWWMSDQWKGKERKYNYSISWVDQPSTVNLIFYVLYLDFHYTFLWLNLS